MSNAQDYKRLRDKFLQAELDYEERESPYRMTLTDLKKLEESSREKKQKSFFEFGLTRRFLKLAFSYFQILMTSFSPVLKILGRGLLVIFTRVREKYQNKKENIEFVFDKKILALEEKKKSKDKMSDIIKNEIKEFEKEYQKELQALFTDVRCTFTMVNESKSDKAVRPSLDLHQNLYELILKKITDSRMILNVEEMQVNLFLNNELVKNKIAFKLKSRGFVWGKLFAKYVMTSIYKKIENYDGKISGRYEYNATKKEDVFNLYFEHCRLLAYVESSDNIFGDKIIPSKKDKKVERVLPLKELEVQS